MIVTIAYSIFSLTMSFGIVIFSGLAAYYTFLWIVETDRRHDTWIKISSFTMYILWIILFLFIGVSYIVGKPLIEPGSFGAFYIRPMIFVQSLFLAINARYSWVSNRAEHGD